MQIRRCPSRCASLHGATTGLGRSLARAGEWFQDGVARFKHQHAELLENRVTPHVVLAGAVGAAAVVADVAAGPALGPIVAVAGAAATIGLAHHAVARVAVRRRLDRERHRAVLAAVILHAERRALCPSYAAEAWRFTCGLPSARRHRAVGVALAKDASRSLAVAAIVRTMLRGVLKRAPWISAVMRIAQLPNAVLAGARLVAAAERHAELLSGYEGVLSRTRLLRTLALRACVAPASNDNATAPAEPLSAPDSVANGFAS